jgi:hypothetical protein
VSHARGEINVTPPQSSQLADSHCSEAEHQNECATVSRRALDQGIYFLLRRKVMARSQRPLARAPFVRSDLGRRGDVLSDQASRWASSELKASSRL